MSAAHCEVPPAQGAEVPRAIGDARILLVGRPNAGKSSLYNRLTGGDARVGNFPGITVDVLECAVTLPSGARATVADLPGFYSFVTDADPDTDEGVAQTILKRAAESRSVEGAARSATVVVQVLDGTQLALGLRLTHELLTHPLPLLVVVTQCDLLERDGHALDAPALERVLGAPVLSVSARDPDSRETVFRAVEQRLAAPSTGAPTGPLARPSWDPDAVATQVLHASDDPVEARKDSARVHRAVPSRRRTERLDAVLLQPVLGPILFLALMTTLFAAVFLVADPVTTVIDAIVQRTGGLLTRWLGQGLLASFITDGLLGGAGTVLAFLPQIVILTVAMELLDASGYLARGAFLVDRFFRAFGLGGRAFVPLLTAHACAVPAVTATRILRDPRERLTTMLVLPLMTCSARIPTYGLLIAAFFAGRSAWFKSLLFVSLYFAGILSGLIASLVLRRTATKGRALPLVLEMPAYRAPEPRAVLRTGRRAATRFIQDVGRTIVIASAVLWVLLTVPLPGAPPAAAGTPERTARIERSLAASVGKALEPITRPVGFDWRINVGLIGSFGARELMVGTMGVIFGIEDAGENPAPLATQLRDARRPDGARSYGAATGLALMAFFVLACQCMSTVAAVRRETRTWRWPLVLLAYTYAAGYLAAWVVYRIAS